MRKKLLLPALLLSQILWGQNTADLSNQTSVMVNSQQMLEASTSDRSTPILFEDFQNGIPSTNWKSYVGLLNDILNGGQLIETGGGGNPWQERDGVGIGCGLNTMHVSFPTTGSIGKNWLVSPTIQATPNCYLTFDISFNKYRNGYVDEVPDLNGTDDKFAIVVKKNGQWEVLALWDNQGSPNILNSLDLFPQTITLPLQITQNSNIQIALYGETTMVNTGNVIHVDNIGVWPTSCIQPTGLNVTNKTKTSALVSWTLPQGITACNLQYKKVASFSEWSTVSINNSSSSYELTSLNPETYYRVRVQSVNQGGESIWSDAITFRTKMEQDDYSLPFVETYPSNSSIPQDWRIRTDAAEYTFLCGGNHPRQRYVSGQWEIASGGNLGNYHVKATCHRWYSNWLITPNIDLSTALNPDNLCLIFDVAKTNKNSNTPPPTGYPENDDEFRVMISTDGGESWSSSNCYIWKNSGGNYTFNTIPTEGTTFRLPLNDYANGTVMVAFYCGSSEYREFAKGFDIHVDNVFIGEASHIFLADGNWNVDQNWQGNIMPNSPSNSVLLKADATIPASYTAHVSSVAMMNGSLTIADGGQLIHDNEGVVATIQKSITKFNSDSDGWQLISHPMSTEIEAEDVTHLMENIYDLYAFDINESLEWRNFKSGNNLTALNANEGYLYSTNTNKTLSFNGTLNPANEVALDNLKYNGNARLKGFNLIGNPFACNAVVNRPTYVMNDAHNNIIVASNYEIAPNEAVFVSVTSDNRTVTITPAYLNQANGNGNGICIEVRKADNTRGQGVLDRALINFSEQDNLEKFTLNANATKVYIPLDGEDFAVLQAQEEGEMPINFKAEDNGNYVLNIYPENMEMSYLHLIDNLTGVETDLLENPNYTFDSKTTDYASRFRLVYSADGNKENFESFAYCSGNTLKINSQDNAIVQVIDILGHVLSSETINGNCEKDMNLCPGVYILRLVSNNSVKTQKIVIE